MTKTLVENLRETAEVLENNGLDHWVAYCKQAADELERLQHAWEVTQMALDRYEKPGDKVTFKITADEPEPRLRPVPMTEELSRRIGSQLEQAEVKDPK